jgi:hypothetical protein
MEVLGSNEELIGVVDAIEKDEIVLVEQGTAAQRHRVPLVCVEAIGAIVRLNRSLDELLHAERSEMEQQPIRHAIAQEANQGPGTV